jgi:hypothetical protein
VTRDELQRILREDDIREDAYSLHGGKPEECLCMDSVGDEWLVYYVERGKATNVRRFASEDAACIYMLEVLRSSPEYRIDYVPPYPPY